MVVTNKELLELELKQEILLDVVSEAEDEEEDEYDTESKTDSKASGSNNSSSGGGTSGVMQIAKKETLMVTGSKFCVMLVLLLATAGCACGTYWFTLTADRDIFENAVSTISASACALYSSDFLSSHA